MTSEREEMLKLADRFENDFDEAVLNLTPRHVQWIAAALRFHASPPDAMREALKRADRLCTEALPKFNWGESALDNNAIRLLNEVPGEIRAALSQANEQEKS